MELVIMAAGMGSRFGGLKQIEPIDDNGNFIIDYSIYDAIKCGFTGITFIIKKENFETFKETVGKRIEDKIKVQYVFQKQPEYLNRTKPLGTAHAILCCKDVVKDNFAIINADDYYGENAYDEISKFLKTASGSNFALVGYEARNTMSNFGSAKRGVCEVDKDKLVDIEESSLEFKDNQIVATSLVTSKKRILPGNTTVSMNLFGFTPKIFEYLEEEYKNFMENNKNDLSSVEFLIPEVIKTLIKKNKINVKILSTKANWHGVTYKEDKPHVVQALKDLTNAGVYPKNLWS